MTVLQATKIYRLNKTEVKLLLKWERDMLRVNPVFEITKRDIDRIRHEQTN